MKKYLPLLVTMCIPALAQVVSQPMANAGEAASYRLCSLAKGAYGQPVYATTPCNFSLATSQAVRGSAITSIKSIPSGATLLIDGEAVSETPATLVLQQQGDRGVSFTVLFKKDGYEGGAISVRDGDVLLIELAPKRP